LIDDTGSEGEAFSLILLAFTSSFSMYYLEKSEIIFCRKMIVAQCNMKKYKTRE
jgi:hypothetical protein